MRAATISVGLLFALGACEPGSAQQSAPAAAAADSAVHRIREHYAAIERELPRYRCRTLEMQEFTTEGGEVRACFAGSRLRKLTATYYRETGQGQEQVYLWDGEVEFVFRTGMTYVTPFPNPAGIRERTEDRFYFAGGRLVQWLGTDGAPRPVAGADARREGAELLEMAALLAACASDAARTVCTP